MKFSIVATLAAVIVGLAAATDTATTVQDIPLPSPQEALDAIQKMELPAGVKLTGTTEPITQSITQSTESKHEYFGGRFGGGIGGGWGGLGWGGWGGWGGWSGVGPYRFGYSCGGLSGWAYPLGYWNAFGSGLFGGGCGLGIPFGGLFYC